ncbi:hypothetical protein IIE63_002641 [Listeria monocytogenes]|uniref:Uncharacterized protein n=1 Tax=Listeria monocytogenes TaxID=1639 RepID=A0A6V9TND7_LISMN|nr:hypothetical protein [Listeria monocytogenes]EAC7886460.1 hypothetical protein [Listeria monocytogenes]EAC8464638.1 hypothetical protein [Listeria monocytogenes]EAD2799482.1 hypothetical protein [Listeria monocytogenes]EAD7213724.1 hypothetical protein [Listeria monocytogenes]EAD7603040.1 hypothetical protein [Listeria monocytogenes]
MTKPIEEIGAEFGAKAEKVARKTGNVVGKAAKISVYSSIWAVKTGVNKTRAFTQGFKQGWSGK